MPYINMNQPRVHMCPHPKPHSRLPPHPVPLGCPRALALSALIHVSNLHLSSILHMVIYMFQCVAHLISFCSVQFNCSVVSNSLRPHESQHIKPPCPSPTPRVYSNPCALSRWSHPATSSSVIPFSSCPQSLPASGSFPMSQLFAWGGQSIKVSASASVLPVNTQDWSALEWTGWISLQSKGLSRVFSSTTVQKHQFFGAPLFSQSNSHIHKFFGALLFSQSNSHIHTCRGSQTYPQYT